MRIRDVRAHWLCAELEKPFGWAIHTTRVRQALLVEVETDDGILGWGESGAGTVPRSGKLFLEDVLRPLAVGEDPFDLELLNQQVRSAFDRAGWGYGLPVQIYSGLEMALWDVMGKAIGRPVCQLLGGRVRERLQAYATGLYYYPSAPDPSATREREARAYVDRGYRAMKMKVGGLAPAHDVREVARIRAAIGEDVALVVDANGAYDSRTAILFGSELERLGVAWFEEPVQRGNVAGYLEVKQALHLPIAGGEHLGNLDQFRELVECRAVDILQPDLANCGGLSEARRIAALAAAFHTRVFPHVWGTPVAVAAALHFAATLPSTPATVAPTPLAQEPVFEFDSTPHPIRDALFEGNEHLRPEAGWLRVPDTPGLGVEVNRDIIRSLSAAG